LFREIASGNYRKQKCTVRAECAVPSDAACSAQGNLVPKGLKGNFSVLMLPHCLYRRTEKANLETTNTEIWMAKKRTKDCYQLAGRSGLWLTSASAHVKLPGGAGGRGGVTVGQRKSSAPLQSRACICNATRCCKECGIVRILKIPTVGIRLYICTAHTAVLFQSSAAIYCQTQHVGYWQEHATLATCFGSHCSHLQALRKPQTNTDYCTWL
jgi:hypothetical protein